MKSIFAVVLCLVSAVAARGVVVERNESIVYFSTNVYLFDDLTTPVHERIGESASNAFVNGDQKLLVGATNESLIRRMYVGNQNQSTLVNVGMAIDDEITNVVSGLSIGGYFDASTLWVTGRVGYSSFASHFGMNGTNDYNLYTAFYDAMGYSGAGSIAEISTFVHYPRIESGIASNVMGAHIYDMRSYSGTGTVYDQYGVYIEQLSKGVSNNYAIYSAGTTPSRFGSILLGTNDVAVSNWPSAGGIDAATAGLIATNVASAGYLPLQNSGKWNFDDGEGVQFLGSADGYTIDFVNGAFGGAWGFTNGVAIEGRANIGSVYSPIIYLSTNLQPGATSWLYSDGTNLYFATTAGFTNALTSNTP